MKKTLLLALCFGIMACGQKEEKKEEAKPVTQEQVQTSNDTNNDAPAMVEEQVTEEVVAVPVDQENTPEMAPKQEAMSAPEAETTTENK